MDENWENYDGVQEDMQREDMELEEIEEEDLEGQELEEEDTEAPVTMPISDWETKLRDIITALQQFTHFEIKLDWGVGLHPINLNAMDDEEEEEPEEGEIPEYDSTEPGDDNLPWWTLIFAHEQGSYCVMLLFSWYEQLGSLPREENMNFTREHKWIVEAVLRHFVNDGLGNPYYSSDDVFIMDNFLGGGFNIRVDVLRR
jgi:hypothetical protein